ncbi:putative thiol-specific antioxidant related protein/Peroxidoxin BcpB [Deinococcus piscis]|uniref:Thiol-specific antioxidant related protein/Peroxidoxin BcpB n=1 Tax=Deinococcus piscis TaxID=394230 RepID=A0ABQ3K6K3_9DEIO|nr:MerR family transcriptional regulator [Deinococcus piscis]GHG02128.1 putative thiol-specific antioxidant related protein/Peroxidoxin BcpB [Deinococcus piscis]
MQASEAARRAGLGLKALRYYEAQGLVVPARLPNGYRDYSEQDVALCRQIAQLRSLGLSTEQARPFVECLRQGHRHGDDCPESLAAYQAEISRLDALMLALEAQRDELQARLYHAARRGFSGAPAALAPTYGLPPGLPVPQDDGRAAHLQGLDIPALTLTAHDGSEVNIRALAQSPGYTVLFIYPTTGVPGQDLPQGWNEIPGARGCTPEACSFRDLLADLRAAGAAAVLGFSHQGHLYQAELADRLRLPYPLLSDPERRLGQALDLPTFEVQGETYYQRLTLMIRAGRIEQVFYPIFPPNEHAEQVLAWLAAQQG